ncbi:MAG TPA: R3H domain-containing nucleic acid-binding protein, partial [Thermomicrobiales bacterium]|nr:R3H domain-containing nucleic acid-binding protein [Thermomicrobiales bacterium]
PEALAALPLTAEPAPVLPRGRGTEAKPFRVYPFGVSRNRLEQAIGQLGVPAVVVRDQRDADLVMTLKNYFRRKPQPLREAEAHGTPVYVLRANTSVQMESVLSGLFPQAAPRPGSGERVTMPPAVESVADADGRRSDDPVLRAIAEAEEAIDAVMQGGPPVALAPQTTPIRRLQHQLAERYNIGSRSRGREPHRRVELFHDRGR